MDFHTFTVYYNLQAITCFMGFKIYDKSLEVKIADFMFLFDECMSYGNNFTYLSKSSYKFHASSSIKQDDYLGSLNKLNETLNALLSYVHENYLEVDLEALNTVAWRSFKSEIQEEDQLVDHRDID